MKRFIIFLVISLVPLILATDPDSTFKHLIHIANIGSRYPINHYPDFDWDYTPMELTSVGMRQMYLLGRGIGHKYLRVMNVSQYNSLEVVLRSIYSDEKYITMAAYAFAAGLYYPGTGYALNKFQIERAVPPTNLDDYKKYKEELGTDAVLGRYSILPIMTLTEDPNRYFEAIRFCSRIDKFVDSEVDSNSDLRSNITKEEEILKEKLYPRLKKILSLKKDVDSMDEALNYTDWIIAAKYFSKDLKDEPTKDDRKLMDKLYYTLKFKKFLANKKVAQLIAHGLLTELKSILEGTTNNAKYILTSYMLEDIHILALLRLMEYEHPAEIMPFGSSLIMLVDKDNTTTIQYNNVTVHINKEPTISREKLIEWISSNLLKNFDISCTGKETEVTKNWFIATLIVGLIFAAILAITWTLIFTCRRTKEEESSPEGVEIE